MKKRPGQWVRFHLWHVVALAFIALAPVMAQAAPYAAIVVDARTGEVLHSRNADTRLHPASLTKMLTLYVAFDAIRRGEVSLDTMVTISAKAAAEPPSKLGLRTGQRISMRNLIRAAAIRSANDAATAIGEAISGSEAAFAERMNRTARAIGMNNSTFRNAHGLTAQGHLSTARDMNTLGRRLFYDFPQYYNLFSRVTTDAGVARISNTNRRFLENYRGADGIKTGYTRAAGFNLTASAERGGKRIIATVFGGASTAQRNARMAELMDMGFNRAPARVAEAPPPSVSLDGVAGGGAAGGGGQPAARTIRLVTAVARSPRPQPRPAPAEVPAEVLVAMQQEISGVLADVVTSAAPEPEAEPETAAMLAEAPDAAPPATAPPTTAPMPRPDHVAETPEEETPATGLAQADTGVEAEVVAEAEVEVAAGVAADPGAETAPVAMALAPTAPPMPRPEALAGSAAETEAEAPADVAETEAAPEPDALPFQVVDADTAEAEAEEIRLAVAEDAPARPENITPTAAVIAPANLAAARPLPRPGEIVMTAAARIPAPERAGPEAAPEVVTRVSTSGGRHWGVNLGRYPTRDAAERALLQTALSETTALDGALRKVVRGNRGFDANFMGLSQDQADLACRRMQARAIQCFTLGP